MFKQISKKKTRIPDYVWLFVVMTATSILHGQTQVNLSVRSDKVVATIDDKIYGHFLEHIYHSCNGGLWGELIWNRSFEQNNVGRWSVEGDEIVQAGMATNQRLVFGDPSWRDYEFTLDAKKAGGDEGFLILFRVKNEKEFYWCNLGGWGNTRHGLERGLDNNQRWGPVGPQPTGSIEAGRWHKVRIRCQGPRFHVWLNEKQIIDFTDGDRAHLTGKVGVGTWATKAVFRNLRVTSLGGDVLYDRIPEVLTQQNTARFWKAYGTPKVYLDTNDSLNSEYCQKVIGTGDEGGLEQDKLFIRKGEIYQGSLWVKGHAPGGLAVSLVGDKGQKETQDIRTSASDWREFKFKFEPAWESDNSVLRIGLKGEGQIWIDQVSMVPDSWRRSGGLRPDLLKAVADLRPPIIRWPGGCFASAYRWKDGVGPQHKRVAYPREIWDDKEVNSFGTDEFVMLCRKVGAEPLIVVNIGTRTWNGDVEEELFLQEVCDWIEYCNGPADSKWGRVRAENGHPETYQVKYWEIDNETWHIGADDYAAAVRRFAPAMKKADPTVKLAACGSAGYGRQGLEWNRVMIERCADLIDYLSIHHYENPDNFKDGPRAYEAFFRQTNLLIEKSANPNLRIYVSEWNAQSTDWRTGLYCGGLLNAFERCGEFLEIGGPALFLRHLSATAWDNAFINFDHTGWFPAPNYVVMKLWRDHFGTQLLHVQGDTGVLNAVATKSADGMSLFFKVVNPSDEKVGVVLTILPDFDIREAKFQLIAPGDLKIRNTLADPRNIKPKPGRIVFDGQQISFELPGVSAGVVTSK
ncbi:MAG: DUF1080 domain-containing protein [Phycisphaerales bacterium]|jgi:alpha-N-arabinofuranosidase